MSIKKSKRPRKPDKAMARNFSPGKFNNLWPIYKFDKTPNLASDQDHDSFSSVCEKVSFKLIPVSQFNVSLLPDSENVECKNYKSDKLFFTKCKLLNDSNIYFYKGKILNKQFINIVCGWIKQLNVGCFRKVDLTIKSKNTNLKSDDIEYALSYLCHKGVIIKIYEESVKSPGRSKSQLYKIISEIFQA